MTEKELIDKIEALVEEYFEENDTIVSEVYTMGYKGDNYKISFDYTFEKMC